MGHNSLGMIRKLELSEFRHYSFAIVNPPVFQIPLDERKRSEPFARRCFHEMLCEKPLGRIILICFIISAEHAAMGNLARQCEDVLQSRYATRINLCR